jgi:hypothetical protein
MSELERLTAYTQTRYENMVYQKKVREAVRPTHHSHHPTTSPPSSKKTKTHTEVELSPPDAHARAGVDWRLTPDTGRGAILRFARTSVR